MPNVAIIIPIAPYHEGIAQRAIASAMLQTVPHKLEIVFDFEARGPSWARNEGLRRLVTKPIDWIIFLDADDEIAPTFIAECMAAATPDTYIYTDWRAGARSVTAPDAGAVYCFCPRPLASAAAPFHTVTALIPRPWFDRVGGFDESLDQGGEDKALFTALNMSGCCGVPLHKPLFTYHDTENSRGDRWNEDITASRALHHKLFKQYGGIMSNCKSCGGRRTSASTAPAIGGVIGIDGATVEHRLRGGARRTVITNTRAQFMSTTTRTPTGRATGFNYDRYYKRVITYPDVAWIDRRDAEASPGAWSIIEDAPEESDGPDYATLIEAGQSGIASDGVFK